MAKRPALGKGIGALLSSATHEGGRKYFLCPIEELQPMAGQPRKIFNDEKLAELVASIREKGVIQPLIVRRQEDYYQIIAGERRWRAAQKAGLREVPVVIQDVSEDWAFEVALIENIQREDLNPLEEAEAYHRLVAEFDLSQEEVARRVGKNRSTVANSLRLLKLPRQLKDDIVNGALSMGHARAILPLEDEVLMRKARNEVVARALTVRATEALIKKFKEGTTPPKVSSEVAHSPELDRLATELQQVLGTKVKLAAKGSGGKIEIVYYTASDLDRLLNILGINV
ncbi:MAG: ParB/RepB/Spo0J family partition protein [Desulfuromonadaceae bacterium]|nr:ParB/RepB/Spo0J family partition protein [Desulfuromonadaceae bacterium]